MDSASHIAVNVGIKTYLKASIGGSTLAAHAQKLTGIILLSMGLAAAAFAEDSVNQEKLQLVKKLVEITGAAANSDQYANAFSQQLISVLRINNPQLSAKAEAIVRQEVSKTVGDAFATESLQKEIYPIYAKYFSVDELRGLIEFNQSPAGQKANQVMPSLLAESTRAAQLWSRSVTPQISNQVLRRFHQEGIEINLSPPQN